MLEKYHTSFEPLLYNSQNYQSILPEDALFIEHLTQTNVLQSFGIAERSLESVIDIGNGGVMIGPGIMSPFVSDSGQIVLADVGNRQLHTIERTIRKGKRGNLGIWQKYEDKMAQHQTWNGAVQRACKLSTSREMNIFDLPPKSFDAASMFYGAESITDNKEDFTTAITKFFEAVRPGGFIIWAAMTGSQGYDSAGDTFHSFWIDPQDAIDVAEDYVSNLSFVYHASSGLARPKDGLQYSGMTLLTGLRR